MLFDKATQEYEQSKLIHITDQIRLQIKNGRDGANKQKKNVFEVQKSMWEHINPTPRDMDDLANIWQYQTDLVSEGNKAIFLSNRVGRLEKMLKNPYFARIDFKEEGYDSIDQIYIGISNLKDTESSNFLVFDWRAPISGMFYDYELGRAGYTCPAGMIEGEILLKRQYRLWNGNIQFMFDSSIAINDDILQEILSKSTDNKMKTIVTSIQREQNCVIRNDTHKLLMVYGPAGSGKTSIALHRAAYLLYRYRESMTSDNIVIFSPNNIFSDYIADVLPELGEENIKRITFFEYALKILGTEIKLEDAARQMEYLLNGGKRRQDGGDDRGDSSQFPGDDLDIVGGDSSQFQARIRRIKYKSSDKIINELRHYVLSTEECRRFEDVNYNGELIETGEEILKYFSEDLIFLPIAKRLEKIRNRLNAKLDALMRKRIEEVVLEVAESGEYPNAAEIRGRSIFIVRVEVGPVRSKIEEMTKLDLLECYKRFLKKYETNNGYGTEIKNKHTGESLNCKDDVFDNNEIYYEDIAPLLLLRGLLYGFHNMHDIKHVIIDEVQDYTPVHFEIFKLIFNCCNMTLLGDTNQAISPFSNPCNTKTITDILASNVSITVQLSKSYRSTRQITEFCKNLIGVENDIECINRDGELPEVICVSNQEAFFELIIGDIERLKADGARSIALITRTEFDCRFVFDNLSEFIEISLITVEKQEFFYGTAVIPSYLSKGLEFDAVLMLCADPNIYDKYEEIKLVYTICTRALHKLHIYCLGGFPGFVKSIGTEFYKITDFNKKIETQKCKVTL